MLFSRNEKTCQSCFILKRFYKVTVNCTPRH